MMVSTRRKYSRLDLLFSEYYPWVATIYTLVILLWLYKSDRLSHVMFWAPVGFISFVICGVVWREFVRFDRGSGK